MSFGGFTSKNSSGSVSDHHGGGGGGGEMVADGLCSYNIMSSTTGSIGPMPQSLQMLHSSHSQPLFNSPLSLALQPKMENFGDMGLPRDEPESRSGSDNPEAASGDDLNTGNQKKPSKRKKYHRHTAFQIQELEASFKDNPHPDEKGRLELGKRLGLEVRQVKFWFQNRRTQMKTQLERHENSILKQENDKLRIENITMRDAMRSPMCENCGCPAILGEITMEQHQLVFENARLKEELNRLGILASKFLTRTPNGSNPKLDLAVGRNGFSGMMNTVDPSRSMPLGLDFGNKMSSPFHANVMSGDMSFDKSCFMEIALAAMDELMKLGQIDSPLWFRSLDGTGESLNLDEYVKTITPCIGEKPSHFETEATRAIGTVMINGLALVETLMDVNQWTEMFPWNIGRASILDVISPGASGNRNCAIQLMEAEFQILSPLVPVRQMKFVRFCKQHREDLWAVVDVSVDALFQGIGGNASVSCRRLPSGCIVQDMPNGYSKVTWIEHTEYDENIVHHLYRPLLRSGMVLGAQKWLINLQRQCELFSVIMSSIASGDHSALHPSGKKSIVKLAQRMTRSFCTGVCATVHKWEVVQNCDNTKLMMRKSIGNSGEPSGIILSATTTVWMPISPPQLLDFLQDEKTRAHWDVLSQDGPMQQMLRVSKGQDLGNDICLLRTSIPASSANPNGMLILQETCTDASGSLIVHAAVKTAAMTVAMNDGDSSGVAILPSGFAIVPDCFPDSGTPGSLLTIGFQILVNNLPAAQLTMESVDTVKSLIGRTIQGIKSGLQCD
ncbi:hypothetical protein CASFOL_010458 [Castilleja foliolosa]|uniref:Homeobox-leucine zipper protein ANTHOCYANINLESS 2-like n=1 Tax=Castilleja foliolosa TaxID=1961234 RepID=A0ABD3DSN0_9LAMI